jgi:hypothetical protein
MLSGAPSESKFPLKDGDELGSYLRKTGDNIEDKTEFKFGFDISFGKSQIFDGEPVRRTLKELVDFVEGTIKSFATHIWGVAW